MSGAEVAARDATAELRALSDRAEGDDDAHAELRIKTIAAGEPLMQEALKVRVEQMRAEVAGENPAPLESMLASRVVSGWLLVEVLEARSARSIGRAGRARNSGARRRTTC